MKYLHNSFFFVHVIIQCYVEYIYPLIELSFFSHSATTCASRASHNFCTYEHQTFTDISIVPSHIVVNVGLLS